MCAHVHVFVHVCGICIQNYFFLTVQKVVIISVFISQVLLFTPGGRGSRTLRPISFRTARATQYDFVSGKKIT